VAVNVIVITVTLLLACFLAAWACVPRLRRWIEAPKYRVLRWRERYPEASRSERNAALQGDQ
jgi:hypothetical protein